MSLDSLEKSAPLSLRHKVLRTGVQPGGLAFVSRSTEPAVVIESQNPRI